MMRNRRVAALCGAALVVGVLLGVVIPTGLDTRDHNLCIPLPDLEDPAFWKLPLSEQKQGFDLIASRGVPYFKMSLYLSASDESPKVSRGSKRLIIEELVRGYFDQGTLFMLARCAGNNGDPQLRSEASDGLAQAMSRSVDSTLNILARGVKPDEDPETLWLKAIMLARYIPGVVVEEAVAAHEADPNDGFKKYVVAHLSARP